MNKVIFTVFLNAFAIVAYAQWSPGLTSDKIYYNGNVGIGTQDPGFKLHIQTTNNLEGIKLSNGSQNWVSFYAPSITNYAYNGITRQGDAGIIFGGPTSPSNAANFGFVITPHRSLTSGIRMDGDGNVGINTSSPRTRFQINDESQSIAMGAVPQQYREALGWVTQFVGFNLVREAQGWSTYSDGVNNGASMLLSDPFGQFKIVTVPSTGNNNRFLTEAQLNSYTKFVVNSAGQVAIGTSSIDAQLTVKGDIHAREVRVDLAGAIAPDYVFKNDYTLVPLGQVESYIKENRHLPEVPSEKQMEEDGINLKEMNLLLLKKVEELTLYLIQHEKDIKDYAYKLEALEKENQEQKAEISAIKTALKN